VRALHSDRESRVVERSRRREVISSRSREHFVLHSPYFQNRVTNPSRQSRFGYHFLPFVMFKQVQLFIVFAVVVVNGAPGGFKCNKKVCPAEFPEPNSECCYNDRKAPSCDYNLQCVATNAPECTAFETQAIESCSCESGTWLCTAFRRLAALPVACPEGTVYPDPSNDCE
jgi:hypothetical protein